MQLLDGEELVGFVDDIACYIRTGRPKSYECIKLKTTEWFETRRLELVPQKTPYAQLEGRLLA